MKALSIKQPWAWLICRGFKDIENRTWRIGRKPAPGFSRMDHKLELPSRIYVHAGKAPDNKGWDWLCDDRNDSPLFHCKALEVPASDGSMLVTDPYEILMEVDGETLGLGAIIGEVDITSCVTESSSPWFVGPYGFILANPKLYDTPIPYRGQLGFFEVKP